MSFFGNDAINRVNLHAGIIALARGAGEVFFLVWLLRAGVPIPGALLAQAGVIAGRFAIRPLVLPLARAIGVKATMIAGAIVTGLQYPLLAEVRGVGPMLYATCAVAATGEVLYFLSANAYVSAVGDAEHRGHQISVREALVAAVNVVAPIAAALGLTTLGPRPVFAAVAAIQALSVLPLLGAPAVGVPANAKGAFRAARIGVLLSAADGWFDGAFFFVWQIALFVSLGRQVAAYGGAMALAGLAGAAGGLVLGPHIDRGGGRTAVVVAYGSLAVATLLRAAAIGSPWLAVAANALGALAMPWLSPTVGSVTLNLAKASPCSFRFQMAAEAGWDVGGFSASLAAAGLIGAGAPLAAPLLLGVLGLALTATILWRYYAPRRSAAPAGG